MSIVSITALQERKQHGEKFAVVTAYDATFARTVEAAGIEVILVGDSLGMVLQGHNSTLPVTTADIAYHTANVARGVSNTLVIADMPFGDYATVDAALDCGTTLMRAGAQMVKLEGGAWLAESVEKLRRCGVPVCGHLGLTPQSVNVFGGFKVQGRDSDNAQQILDDARALEAAGIAMLVLECVPRGLAAEITGALSVPVIGIGAGPDTDAQVLVMHDLLGLTPRAPRFVRNFMSDASDIEDALNKYRNAVHSGEFPAEEHCFK